MAESDSAPLRDIVADTLRERIATGVLAPGSRVREESLAAELGVSRIPVREALQRLEAEGFIALTPRRGASVAVPSVARVFDLLEVRTTLEVFAAVLAARRAGGDYVEELTATVKEGTAAAENGEFKRLPALIERFHDLVARASGNTELTELLKSIRGRVRWMFEHDLEGRSPSSWAKHAQILEAILAADEEAASDQMARDVQPGRALASWAEAQRRNGTWASPRESKTPSGADVPDRR
jgi:DNA-binding GntR family transcriptional regulator